MRLTDLPPGIIALLLLPPLPARAFYLPGISPINYKRGDRVALNVNHLTPSQSPRDSNVRSVLSFEYYHPSFHFCEPEGGPQDISESLGSILFGDRIKTSPFELFMGKNETCKALCADPFYEPRDAKFVNRRIWQNYNINWLVDGLPVGQEFEEVQSGKSFYQPGFLLGRVVDEQPRLHNHYDILIDYHEARKDEYRVVGIQVEPYSIGNTKVTLEKDGKLLAECGTTDHPVELSEEEGSKVAFTYDIQWRPSRTSFATRWDRYLHVEQPRIHWLWLIINAVVVMFLVGMVSSILVRTLKKDIMRYNRLDQLGLDDFGGTSAVEDGVQEDSGWKLVHGDVFRPPKNPLILAVLIGNGAQLFAMAGLTIAFALLGFLSPSNRGSLATVMILLHTLFGFLGGYASSRVYKSFRGQSKWKQLFILTPLSLPATVFSTMFSLNLFVWARRSSGAVPFGTMLVLVGIWFAISVPLSLAGSWLGFKQALADPPVRTNQIPRQIPPSRGYLRFTPSLAMAGILPFLAMFVELSFILNSLWSGRIYYMFGFLFLVYGLFTTTSAAVAIIMVYFLLCTENYRWQWRAFAGAGSSAFYVFAYCLYYWASMLRFGSLTGGVLYLGYSALISGLVFVLSGTIGFFACWVFVHRIYGSIKVD